MLPEESNKACSRGVQMMQERHYRLDRFVFRNKGQKLIAAIWIPSETEKLPPGLLVLHGFPGAAPIMNDLTSALCQARFAPMMFHYRGSWGSGGRYDFLGALEDARKALAILSSREDVDTQNLAVIGHSFGGLVATYTTARDVRVKAVIALCPVASIGEHLTVTHRKNILKRGLPFVSGLTITKAQEQWETLARRYDPVQYVDKISPRPLLLIHGDKDDIIPIDCSMRLFSKAREPKELFVVEGADHIFAGRHRVVTGKVVSWLRSALSLSEPQLDKTR